MFAQLSFYFRHSLNDLRVNGRRTFFAILCIAAGVAAVVSLQTLAVMIGDTLSRNLQATNRGDIQLEVASEFGRSDQQDALQQGVDAGILSAQEVSFFGTSNIIYYVSTDGVESLQAWLAENFPGATTLTYPYEITDQLGILTSSGDGTVVLATEAGTEATSVSPVLINPRLYPFYNEIRTLDGALLADVLLAPTDIVLDRNLANTLEAEVGDFVRLNGANADFVVRGIVPTEAEVTDPFSGFFAALFGFYYLDTSAIQYFDDVSARIETLYIRLQDPTRLAEINRALVQTYPFFSSRTTQDLQDDNEELVNNLNQLVTVMGLVSLLLGSIGIVNTMQVIVHRRTVEVAVLKTMGLQANQITILFLVEAFIMGIVGSLAGIVLGWAATFLIKSIAEALIAQELAFRIALGPVLNGLIVGVLVTTIFGFLPTLSAGQVRPSVVLRPNDQIVPRAGYLQTLTALVFIVLALALVANTIVNNFGLAVGAVIGAFVAAGIIYGLLLLLIWLIARFLPSFGSVDLKISLRQMLVTRARGAITLLELVVGVFSLSLITLFAESITQVLDVALTSSGNIIVTAASESSLQQVEQTLASLEGVESYQVIRSYGGSIITLEQNGTTYTVEELRTRINENMAEERARAIMFGAPEDLDMSTVIIESLSSINAYPLSELPTESLIAGRLPTAEDAGRPVLVLRDNNSVRNAGINVGDRITLEFTSGGGFGFGGGSTHTLTFEVIGLVQPSIASGFNSANVFTTVESIAGELAPSSIQVLATIAEDQIPALRRGLADIPGSFALETNVINKLISGLLGTFTAFPTLVAALGLIVGGVVIANSVALATLERRREIAVMKSIGLQRERVLAMLLLENGIMGLIGGLIGVGIGLVALVLLLAASGGGTAAIPYGTALLLMLLCIGVALIAALTSAWGAAGEKPLNVLRYD
ncbi:MAG: FtsX-like permease family protein [Chloroflexi bacterium]|nr:FtsX-like permease family protein [Chloroflexota bacterium]